jgi:transposase
LSREEMERRRLAAGAELAKGVQQRKIARDYGVSEATVSRWAKAVRTRGVESLRRTKAYRPPRLTPEQLGELLEILVAGAEASGFDTDLWTTERVALVIKKQFEIEFHPDHVRKILKNKLGLSYQKPKRVARERDEKARATWLRTTWPRLKKTR